MGTAEYIAPEQAWDSHNVDIRADLYSLGCTLYKLLTGRAPFESRGDFSPLQQLAAHAKMPPPPLDAFRSDVPVDLLKIVNRLLAKTPADRFSTPRAVAEHLAVFATGNNLL